MTGTRLFAFQSERENEAAAVGSGCDEVHGAWFGVDFKSGRQALSVGCNTPMLAQPSAICKHHAAFVCVACVVDERAECHRLLALSHNCHMMFFGVCIRVEAGASL